MNFYNNFNVRWRKRKGVPEKDDKSDKSSINEPTMTKEDAVANDDEKESKQKKPKKPPRKFSWNQIIARVVIFLGAWAIACFLTRGDKERNFATRKETIIIRSQEVDCSPEYLAEISGFTACVPNACGRFVTDSLVTKEEALLMIELAKAGLAFGGGSGGVAILDLHSGALSMGNEFVNIYSLPEARGFLNEAALNAYKSIRVKIAKAISDKFAIDVNAIYLTHPTFISRIDNSTAKTVHDEYWHRHVDKETYNSFHYTSLLYLNDFHRDFEGGRFAFNDDNEETNRTTKYYIEPKKGRVSVFTSGGENVHNIEKVTSGTRYAITISFTCNREYAIADPTEQKRAQPKPAEN